MASGHDGVASTSGSTFASAPQRNVLYIVFDDLRPDISAYGQHAMHTPAMQKLADSGLVFERAYCQQAVCSPSRNSFSTGRRPNSTKVWNFINHFRQASCETQNAQRHVGVTLPGGFNVTGSKFAVFNPKKATGGAAQCCTACSTIDGCVGWSFNATLDVKAEPAPLHREWCTLFSSISSTEPCPIDPKESTKACVSGARGAYEQWTPLPAHFRNHGYLVLGAGKYYHDGGGGRGGAPGDRAHPRGQGTPPLADRHLSWSDVPVQWPNQTALTEQWGAVPYAYGNFEYLVPDDEACAAGKSTPSTDYCTPSFAEDGTPPTPPRPGQQPLADFITYKKAVEQLRYAAAHRTSSGQPFFLVAGIKRPHLNWRTPPHYPHLYPALNVSLPKQHVLDRSIWAGAFSVFPMDAPPEPGGERVDFVTSPYVSGSDYQLRELRRHYYAAVSWADRAAGKVLDELDTLQLRDHTLVVLHSDHGWHLGEYAMWEKRTLWELGTRVPMIMRVPWLPASHGQRSRALVELVDIYPTLCDLMGLPPPDDDTLPLDGISLRPVLEAPSRTAAFKPYALSTFPRCEHVGMPIYGQRGAPGAGEDNSCLGIERTAFTYMGYSMRTDRYRYTEWLLWNGSALAPLWDARVATELYDHLGDDGPWTDPDAYENVNLAPTTDPALLAGLSKLLREAFRSAPDRY